MPIGYGFSHLILPSICELVSSESMWRDCCLGDRSNRLIHSHYSFGKMVVIALASVVAILPLVAIAPSFEIRRRRRRRRRKKGRMPIIFSICLLIIMCLITISHISSTHLMGANEMTHPIFACVCVYMFWWVWSLMIDSIYWPIYFVYGVNLIYQSIQFSLTCFDRFTWTMFSRIDRSLVPSSPPPPPDRLKVMKHYLGYLIGQLPLILQLAL